MRDVYIINPAAGRKDSTEELTSIEDFYDKGDAAPLGRLNFVYRGTKKKD